MLKLALADCQTRVDAVLAAHIDALPQTAPALKAAMRHGALIGGKRIRPFLVYAVGELLGVDKAKLDRLAAAVECVHAYSLIHDDLPAMDDDNLRRGKPTVHIAFDEATAILAGDALQTLAFEIISEADAGLAPKAQVAMIAALAKASGYLGMCGGQALDLAGEGKSISLDELTRLHNLKTGALIRAAVELALIAADASDTDTTALRAYADAIGLAFQVQDDILDITATTEEIGKPQGSDLDANKSTYPKLLGLDGARQTADALVADALSALAKMPYNSQLLADFARYIVARRV
ncbi:(2E,6E)-farnesyl diphosphate synthase [Shewanella zhangzhouensis]|uniref:(2E,6E)-farnesyl diphosphate synthase n=1 Tax=Shewanella zhangzhouensis TaxID=2864213 RepID=UPI001C65F1F6|nr:(2E,6E)-farnesyl diphosphate synthase [Shewanella zhangzhouensis]QYK04104.1 (2E,6E)-farnesyl diphosphate synthase [Shewanella zhangzhouensis]